MYFCFFVSSVFFVSRTLALALARVRVRVRGERERGREGASLAQTSIPAPSSLTLTSLLFRLPTRAPTAPFAPLPSDGAAGGRPLRPLSLSLSFSTPDCDCVCEGSHSEWSETDASTVDSEARVPAPHQTPVAGVPSIRRPGCEYGSGSTSTAAGLGAWSLELGG